MFGRFVTGIDRCLQPHYEDGISVDPYVIGVVKMRSQIWYDVDRARVGLISGRQIHLRDEV